ncbi:hypothetical protein M23134_02251 [Microscilla marina ATCC 23134]|uniref:Uncharacterized protein n=1 Tax=Microscilla marina ATCC 23134 TaxID=313606 RepID=A1ZK34_MICM2|nr:hypothetical protein M23134_02251 [Microscilla marina ATCC 23134]
MLTPDLIAQTSPQGKYMVKFKDQTIRYWGTLEIKKFNTFEFRARSKEMNCKFSLGQWISQEDTLTLNSFKENELPDQFQFQTLFCKWWPFEQKRLLIKKNKLIVLRKNQRGKWRKGKAYRRK